MRRSAGGAFNFSRSCVVMICTQSSGPRKASPSIGPACYERAGKSTGYMRKVGLLDREGNGIALCACMRNRQLDGRTHNAVSRDSHVHLVKGDQPWHKTDK